MEMNQPFVRIFFEKHAPELKTDGGLFYLHTASGQAEIAAVSSNKGNPRLIYPAWPEFHNKYSALIPLGSVYKWDHKAGLSAWLDSIVYHSFLLHNEQGVLRCWFVKNIPGPNPYAHTRVPLGFERFFNQETNSF